MYISRKLNYRIVGIFQGYKCSWFLLIKHILRTFIPTNLISHACMLLFRENLSKWLSAKVYTLKIYPLYGICVRALLMQLVVN